MNGMESIKEHICPEARCFDDETRIIYGPSINNDWGSWILQITHLADKKEVEMGEAEFVGELTHQVELAIKYCPFCGVELRLPGPEESPRILDLTC